jgi:hypothetical protein
MGRPSTFTQEIADEICARVMESDYGLEEICEADDLPSARTVFRWLAAHESFRQQYARAKEAQGHVQADRGLKDALTATDASLGRLKFDARKWAASKLAPKQYGDKLELGGGLSLEHKRAVELTDDELVAIAAGSRPGSS